MLFLSLHSVLCHSRVDTGTKRSAVHKRPKTMEIDIEGNQQGMRWCRMGASYVNLSVKIMKCPIVLISNQY